MALWQPTRAMRGRPRKSGDTCPQPAEPALAAPSLPSVFCDMKKWMISPVFTNIIAASSAVCQIFTALCLLGTQQDYTELYWLIGGVQLVLPKGLGCITSRMDCLTAKARLLELSLPLPQGMETFKMVAALAACFLE